MNGWTDGVAYTDLEIVKNSYYASNTGEIRSYNGWDRTSKFVPCHGATSLSLPQSLGIDACNWFFNEAGTAIRTFRFSNTGPSTVNVPANAYTFGLSMSATNLAKAIADGIIPNV